MAAVVWPLWYDHCGMAAAIWLEWYGRNGMAAWYGHSGMASVVWPQWYGCNGMAAVVWPQCCCCCCWRAQHVPAGEIARHPLHGQSTREQSAGATLAEAYLGALWSWCLGARPLQLTNLQGGEEGKGRGGKRRRVGGAARAGGGGGGVPARSGRRGLVRSTAERHRASAAGAWLRLG